MKSQIRTVLKERFGLESFRTGQEEILNSILKGKDALAVMPTGRGKSLCYQLPALVREGIAIIISPLIALMKDQVRSLEALGIPAGAFYSGQSVAEKRELFSRLRNEKHFILYISPERVQKEGFSTWIKRQKISLFAIDEAHCVSQWGPDFRPDYHKLDCLRTWMPDVPILALTATGTPAVLKDVVSQLKLKNPERHVHGFYRPNLFYQVENCAHHDSKIYFLQQSLRQTPKGRILIYCGTRKQTEELDAALREEFPDVGFYHAGLKSEARSKIQNQYETSKIRILAATNAFGMGIDHPNVRLVVHYQMPANIEALYQEAGRAGRDGEPSTCLLLYCLKDRALQSFFIRRSEAPALILKQRWSELDAITRFSETSRCRHVSILNYFRDSQKLPRCGHCDVCDPKSNRRIVLEAPPSNKKQKKKATASGALSDEGEKRYETLRLWRKEYADSQRIPPFLVFSNKTLRDLVERAPSSPVELEGVFGIGQVKIEQFGDSLLSEIAKW